MKRSGRLALDLGTAVLVVGLCKAHAVASGYVWSGSSRLGWSIAWIALLCTTAYAFGLPDQTRTRRAAVVAAVLATVSAALAMSAIQLFAGDALLPRFVVFGSVLALVPYYVLCAMLSADIDDRVSDRDRVFVVAASDETRSLEADLARGAERSALIVGDLTPVEAASTEPAADPAAGRRRTASGRHRRRPRPRRAGRRRRRRSKRRCSTSRGCGSARCRCSTSSGSASFRCPSSSASRCCSTSASCTPRGTHA